MEEQLSAGDNRQLGAAVIFYSTLILVSLAIGLYGFVSLFSLATSTLSQSHFVG